MSSLLSKAKEKLSVGRSEGMAGMGTDQGALQDQSMASDEAQSKYEEETATYGTASKGTSQDMSGIGVDQSKLGDDYLGKYESKYGKADENFAQGHDATKTMSGLGTDQSQLHPKEP